MTCHAMEMPLQCESRARLGVGSERGCLCGQISTIEGDYTQIQLIKWPPGTHILPRNQLGPIGSYRRMLMGQCWIAYLKSYHIAGTLVTCAICTSNQKCDPTNA
jgi:hypothetical protein